jgi:hypothetical protein
MMSHRATDDNEGARNEELSHNNSGAEKGKPALKSFRTTHRLIVKMQIKDASHEELVQPNWLASNEVLVVQHQWLPKMKT